MLSHPVLAPLVFRVGDLLEWLPLDDPTAAVWPALGELLGVSAEYLRHGWSRVAVYTRTADPGRNIGRDMQWVLLLLNPTPQVIDVLVDGLDCTHAELARRWCDDLLGCAWQVWVATQPAAPGTR